MQDFRYHAADSSISTLQRAEIGPPIYHPLSAISHAPVAICQSATEAVYWPLIAVALDLSSAESVV